MVATQRNLNMGAWLTTGVSSSDQSSSSSLSPSGMSSGVRNFNSCSLGKLQAPRGIGRPVQDGTGHNSNVRRGSRPPPNCGAAAAALKPGESKPPAPVGVDVVESVLGHEGGHWAGPGQRPHIVQVEAVPPVGGRGAGGDASFRPDGKLQTRGN